MYKTCTYFLFSVLMFFLWASHWFYSPTRVPRLEADVKHSPIICISVDLELQKMRYLPLSAILLVFADSVFLKLSDPEVLMLHNSGKSYTFCSGSAAPWWTLRLLPFRTVFLYGRYNARMFHLLPPIVYSSNARVISSGVLSSSGVMNSNLLYTLSASSSIVWSCRTICYFIGCPVRNNCIVMNFLLKSFKLSDKLPFIHRGSGGLISATGLFVSLVLNSVIFNTHVGRNQTRMKAINIFTYLRIYFPEILIFFSASPLKVRLDHRWAQISNDNNTALGFYGKHHYFQFSSDKTIRTHHWKR